MAAIDYVVRDGEGRLVRGTVGPTGLNNQIAVDTQSEVSLNLAQGDIRDYRRLGETLEITLMDGRVLYLEGFFSEVAVTESRLYLSADGELTEITFSETWGRTNYAHYDGNASTSAEGELLFDTSSGVVTETETTMAAVPVFLGGGWGAAAAAAGGITVLGGGGGGGGGGGTPVPKTVGEADDGYVGGDGSDFTIEGTAPEGTRVIVTIGDAEGETTVGADGTWTVTIPHDDLPEDGSYTPVVTFISPDGTEEEIEGSPIVIDTTAPDLSVSAGTKGVGDVIDAEWHEGGVELSGDSEPGAVIVVTIDGSSQTTVTDDDGNWFVNFPHSVVPGGEYETPVQITSTDAAGNVSTLDDTLVVDTVANLVDLGGIAVAVDNIINDAENDAGVTVSGTATPGATVVLTLAGVQVSVDADDNGDWTASFGAGGLPQGEYDATLVATVTDAAGNTDSDSQDVRVDTLGSVSIATSLVEGDGTINAVEAADGITVTGSTQPGSSVSVKIGAKTYQAVVDDQGNWTVDVPASDIGSGEYSTTATATATDAAGNVSVASGNLTVDTDLSVAFDATQADDNLITASEANAGIILTGTTQPGASVEITLNGVTRAATVSSDGTWAASFTAGDLPSGVMQLAMSASATDAAGNTATDTGTIDLDTLGFVAIGPDPVEGDNIVNAVELTDGVIFTGSTQPGSTVNVTFAGETYAASVAANGTWTVGFPAGDIPSGTYLATVSATAQSPSGNLATTTAQVQVDTQIDGYTLTSGTVGGDGTLGAAELGAGVTITGTTEPGAGVVVTLGGVSTSATVSPDGMWTVTFAAGTIPSGEYATTLSAVTTDVAGNTETIAQNVQVDTVAGTLTLSGEPIETDDIVNQVEEADGVSITGTADAGAVVQVTLGSVIKTVITGSDGSWSAYYASNEIPDGTYTANIQAVTVDAAGNIATVADTIKVDTELTNFAFSTAPIEGDDRITGAEAADGVTVSGTVEVGSTVTVKLGDTTVDAVVSDTGAWTANFAAGDIEDGEYTATFTATATDTAGNVSVITDTAQVDTAVTNLAITSIPVGDGQVLNAAAADDGITFGGTVEAGSTVQVTFEGVTRMATVSATGAWTVDYADSEIPVGEYTAEVSVLATDSYGNTDTTSASFDVDSQAPGAPLITAFSTGWTGLRGISTLLNDNEIEIAEITDQGAAQSLSYTATEDPAFGELNINFTSPVSDGSDLVVTAQDDAGNSTGTLFVLEDEADPSVNLSNAGLSGFDIEAVDLQFASDADLVLTPEMVKDLSANSDSLTIHGGQDDQVTMTGAVKTSEVRQIGTQSYDVYTLGDDGVSIIVDQDIDVII